jgi:hypothetical protein
VSDQLAQVTEVLRTGSLHAVLKILNARTVHRFTGVYRYDGDTLRNVALFDRFAPDVERGGDAPMVATYCAIVPSVGDSLEVTDGRSDSRFPWMQDNAVVYYCGVQICDHAGAPVGTLCHYDLKRCQTPSGELPLMGAVAPLLYEAIKDLAPPANTLGRSPDL